MEECYLTNRQKQLINRWAVSQRKKLYILSTVSTVWGIFPLALSIISGETIGTISILCMAVWFAIWPLFLPTVIRHSAEKEFCDAVINSKAKTYIAEIHDAFRPYSSGSRRRVNEVCVLDFDGKYIQATFDCRSKSLVGQRCIVISQYKKCKGVAYAFLMCAENEITDSEF